MSISFETSAQVRFAHVDGASIVFFPRYFEILNAAIEDWFDLQLGADFKTMHVEYGIGVPTVHIETEFIAPSTVGDRLAIFITPRKVGRSSCTYDAVFKCGEEIRLKVTATLVCMDLQVRKSVPWPEDIRARMIGDPAAVA